MNRKSYAEKVAKGTLNVTREKQNESAEHYLTSTPIISKDPADIKPPATLKTKLAKDYYLTVTGNLLTLGILSPVDLPQIEVMCKYLEERIEIQKQLDSMKIGIDSTDKEREVYQYFSKMRDRLSNQFDTLAKKYYISPMARAELKLTELEAIQKQQQVGKYFKSDKQELIDKAIEIKSRKDLDQTDQSRLIDDVEREFINKYGAIEWITCFPKKQGI